MLPGLLWLVMAAAAVLFSGPAPLQSSPGTLTCTKARAGAARRSSSTATITIKAIDLLMRELTSFIRVPDYYG